MIFLLSKLNLFVKLVAFWFLFVEPVACWFLFVKLVSRLLFSSKNFYFDFSLPETDFVNGTCWILIFVFRPLLRANSCSWNLLPVDFTLRKTCTLIFLLLKQILFIERVAYWFLCVKFVACWFFSSRNWFWSWNLLSAEFVRFTCGLLSFLFVKFLYWFFFSWNWISSWNMLRSEFFFVELVACWVLYVKLVACLFYSLLNLYFDFSLP